MGILNTVLIVKNLLRLSVDHFDLGAIHSDRGRKAKHGPDQESNGKLLGMMRPPVREIIIDIRLVILVLRGSSPDCFQEKLAILVEIE